mmetsp:Transcript_51626/g.122865  ORF Transcript_51626/g.122865 Transcript_51626/m.122865 type:complete len:194 (+) Transcript_51626:107-688(+)|eukprot:CAMPEP_0178431074 /NCGR_PEP_ID=MMETSP0689_2-20121128/31650_1 /TAXON_ID=160604 /ORGANISM="Amphidinium massartii, Strain CS-259" /LENGTH=193 /DNA_ID=CAMNT_0020052955 /DNA_START=107 /DNA_END=688 /DNA_ORIENTATION=-
MFARTCVLAAVAILANADFESCTQAETVSQATALLQTKSQPQPQPSQLVDITVGTREKSGPCQYLRGMTNVSCAVEEPFNSAPCGMANQLYIAPDGERFMDAPDREQAIQICGPVCNKALECSGFNWMDGKCYFRRTTDLVPPCQNAYLTFWEGATCFRRVDCVAPYTTPPPLPNCSEQLHVETAELVQKPKP